MSPSIWRKPDRKAAPSFSAVHGRFGIQSPQNHRGKMKPITSRPIIKVMHFPTLRGMRQIYRQSSSSRRGLASRYREPDAREGAWLLASSHPRVLPGNGDGLKRPSDSGDLAVTVAELHRLVFGERYRDRSSDTRIRL